MLPHKGKARGAASTSGHTNNHGILSLAPPATFQPSGSSSRMYLRSSDCVLAGTRARLAASNKSRKGLPCEHLTRMRRILGGCSRHLRKKRIHLQLAQPCRVCYMTQIAKALEKQVGYSASCPSVTGVRACGTPALTAVPRLYCTHLRHTWYPVSQGKGC